MTKMLLSRLSLKLTSDLKLRKFLTRSFFVLLLFSSISANAQLFWRTDGVGGTLTGANNWGLAAGGPFTATWTNGSNINFTAATNNITYVTNTPVGNITISNGATLNLTAAGTYTTGAAIRTVDIGTGGILNWNGQAVSPVAGTGFIKTGAGTWNIAAQANAYPGGFTMSAGTVTFTGNNAFGTGALTIGGGIITPANGTARIMNSSSLTITGSFQIGGSAGVGNVTFGPTLTPPPVTLSGAGLKTITIGNTGTYTFNGAIGGAGGLGVATISTGKIVLSNGANNYTGGTTISSGILEAGIANCLPTTTALSFGNVANTSFTMNGAGFNQTVGSLAGGGPLGGNIIMGANNLTTGGDNTSTSYGGIISGSGTFTKNGTGTQTLTGANTYSGTTTVNAGSLFVNGSTSSLSAVTVASAGTLGGSGTVAGTVSVSGKVSPGSAASATGTLNTGATTFNANSTYSCEVSNAAGTQGTSSGWDFINSSGAINVSNTPINIILTGLSGNGFNPNSAYTWIIATGSSIVGFNAANFTITQGGFGATGTFAIEQSGNSLQIVYTPPSGNVITLFPASQLSAASFCNGVSGNVITLTYVTSGTVTAPAIELSNSTGSFASGTVQLAGTITPGSPNTITGTIPSGQTASALYRVRIVSADATPVISADNGNNITIVNAVAPSVSIALTTGTNPACAGTSLTFTATPTNGGTPGYQWKKNGTNIAGATSSTYTTTTLANGDIITCVMTPSGSCVTAATATSNSITMTINPLPANPSNPVAAGTNPSCGANTLNSMSSDPNTDFYWQGTVLNGQSTANPTTANYPVSTSGTYYVTSLSNNGCWSAGSGSIVLTVSSTPSISVQPVDKTISANGNTTFSVTATNASGYQWQVDQGSGFTDVLNGGVYSGATTSTLTLTAVPIGYSNYIYQCIVKGGGCADVVSSSALLTVNPVPWEDFETGTKAAYAIGNVTCTAGSWSFNNALLGTDVVNDYIVGNQSARININGDITMNFNLTSLGVVKLSHRVYGTDANSTWQLQASTDNGATWTAFTSSVFTSTTTVQTETILINILGNVRFRIVNKETTGSHRINIDDIYVTTYTGCTTPTAQATYTNVTGIGTTTMTINFAAGTGGNGRIVVMKQGSAISGFPTSGVSYNPGSSNFSAALPTIATNEKVVYNGTGTSVTVTGLSPNTDYYFEIFEYAGTNCYLVSNVSNTGMATTNCNTPATGASSVNATAVTSTTATINWTNGSGTNRLVVVNAGSAVTGVPVNGTNYSVNTSYTIAPAFTPGTGKTVYNSTSNTVSLTNLSSNTIYYVSVFEFNNTSNCYVSAAATITFTTGSLLSDIVSADGESSCISSVVNGVIATVADGTQVWQFTVRDGGASAPDADALPTIVNSIVITQGTSNTVTDWTNIQSAALFDGSTLISSGVITSTTITFSGAPLISVADNAEKTLSLRITLKNTTTIPATIDGKQFRFSISQGNITLAASGTSGKNTSALVATTDITKDFVCVVATKLVFTVQPTTTGQNQLMSPNVVVTAYDANNNVDLDFTQVVSITASGGGLIGSPITATAINGKATFTGIKHSIIGTGYIMTATSAGVTNGVSTSYDITTYTTFAPGDFAILAVNNNNSNGVDEIAFVIFNDMVTNTEFYMTDNGYERANAGKWGTSEGIVRLKYTGVATVPAGTIFVVQGNSTSFTMLKCGVNDNANWAFTPNVLTTGAFNINNSDQVWFTQGGAWSSASGSLTGQDAVTTGNVLYGWSGIDWKANIGNTSPTWTTQGSRIYPQMNCFSTNLSQSTDLGRTKYVGLTTPTTRLGWISRINDKTNWLTYASNALYDAALPNYAGGGLCLLTVNASVPVDGKWTGSKNVDWFDCNNWDTRSVPNASISVTISSTASNPCVVDNVTYASNASQYSNSADCFNLTVDGQTLSTGNAADVINVNGNFILQNAATLNMTGGGTFNLQTGSWTKTGSTFTSGTGTVSYNSSLSQTIAAENYFNLTSTSTGDRDMSTLGTVGIAGAFTKGTNNYTFTNSTVDYNGSGAQNIAAFTAGAATGSTYENLTVSNAGIKSLSGATDVEGDFTLNNSATLALGSNYLTLKSTAAKTARVAPVSSSAAITYGTGRFVVERYFPGRRAWRLLTAPVTADATNTLFNSWQVGGSSLTGSGTYITGPNETAGNGLDVSPQHNFSLKTFNQLTSSFDGVANTKTNLISGTAGVAGTPDNIGYFMFVRGDRTPANVDAFNQFGTVVETTLRDTGKIQTQNYVFNCNPSSGTHKYTLIGNPYASPVDFANLTRNNVANKFWAWDPTLNGSNGVGGYAIVDLALGTVTTVPTGGATTQTQIIQSKQAFLVETTGASPTVTFGEAAKSSTNNLNLFRPGNSPVASLAVNLFIKGSDGSAQISDGVLAQYNDNFSMGSDMLDAVKFTNVNETFSIRNGRNFYMLERRPLLNANDTVFFSFNRARQLHYRFSFTLNNIIRQKNYTAYLEDKFLKTATPLNMRGETEIDFEVNGNAGSAASDRFFITFKKSFRFDRISAQNIASDVTVNWSMDNAPAVDRYEVERSTDGEHYTKVMDKLSKETGATGLYDATDTDVPAGTYYYRVKAVSASLGAQEYSEAVKVKVTKDKPGMYVYPNPVTDNVIALKMNRDYQEGIYVVRLLNTAGQQVIGKKIQHTKAVATELISIPSSVTAGNYQLEVTGPDNRKIVLNVLIAQQ